MGRTARDKRPYVPPVTKIELNARHTKVRLALAVLFFALGISLIVFALNGWLSSDPGWVEIEASASEANCAGDFTLLYPLGANGSPTAERKALTLTYSEACTSAYQLFTSDASFDGINNPRTLNERPNEELPLDPALYRALEQVADSGERSLYLAPLHEVYDNIFTCEDPVQTADFDPGQNEELRQWFARVCGYANDPEQINIELLGDNRARLFVSEEYLGFAQAEEIGRFIDFGWMRNAFIADYLAERLTGAGYRIGTLSSSDGFMRNLDELSDADYAVNLPDFDGEYVFAAGTMHYRGARALVSLCDFPLGAADTARFAPRPDGSFAAIYLDPKDGLSKFTPLTHSIMAYSTNRGCAEIALRLAPAFLTDEANEAALTALAQEGIESVYFTDGEIRHTEDGLQLETPSAE